MSRKYKILDQSRLYFVSISVIKWIDLFIRNQYKNILLDSLSYCHEKKGLDVFAWCIMTSHAHLIIGTHGSKMEDILRDFKSFTSHKLRLAIEQNPSESRKEWMLQLMYSAGFANSNNRGFQLWQQDNHPIELSTNEMMDQRLDYLHNNPVKAGFVTKPEEYLYSSARNYAGEAGLLKIMLLE
jgi:putative transposase